MADQQTPKWTKQQLQAIKARDGDVLVSASAGTGKTAVLSGRCVDIVSDKTTCSDVWSILVLTFTDAAAEQMRARIADHLRKAITAGGDSHLRHQLLLLQGSDISTIHAFCKRLITDHFHELGIDPAFRIIDANEARLLKTEILEKTIDWAWQQPNLTAPLEKLFHQRDIRTSEGFLSRIIAISDFLDGAVSRTDWYQRAQLLTEQANTAPSMLGEKQKQIVADKLHRALSQLEHTCQLYIQQKPNGPWAQTCRDKFIEPIRKCLELLNVGNWDEAAKQILSFEKPRLVSPKEIPDAIKELIKKTVKAALDSVASLAELAVLNPDYLDKVGSATSLQTKVLIELVRKFDQLYDQAKRSVNCMDFADLEHYALKLLTESDPEGDSIVPSQTALSLRNRYKYIFVDEYQDINFVQKTILDMLSAGGNVFVVGDVKQSIYAWRGAEPDIFIKELTRAAAESTDKANSLRVDLTSNFRSTAGILDFVNKVFGRIMTASFAGIDYDESAILRPGTEDETPTEKRTCPVEFHLLERDPQQQDRQNDAEDSSGSDSETLDIRRQQAALIAQRIRQIIGTETGKPEFQVFDKQQDTPRDVEYRDIVILMRSLAKKAADYVQVLRLAGIPLSCESVAGYFEATEISDMLCLLKVLDNPRRDIELAAVLRSPLFGISDSELAEIRLADKTHSGSFYQCVLEYSAENSLTAKLKDALKTIDNWRTLARRGSLADLIWRVYRHRGYLSFMSALPNGQARRANLLKLHDRAIQFEGFISSGPVASLTRFVEFIEKLQELGQDWAPAEPDSSAANAVRILSVHKSKGLEFPVVFLAELNTQFNTSATTGDCLTDSENTLGIRIIDRTSNSRLASLAHQVIAEQKRDTDLAEEMRILYVATTRAKERLIITASEKSARCRSITSDGLLSGPGKITDWQLRSCTSSLQWLLYGLCDQKKLHTALETDLETDATDEDLFDFTLHTDHQQLSDFVANLRTEKLKRAGTAKAKPTKDTEKLLAKVKESIHHQYRFGDSPMLPAKMSVTQITHRGDEFAIPDYSGVLDRLPAALAPKQDTSAARLIGTATHLLITELDLTKPIDADTVEATLQRLTLEGAVPEPIAARIDTESIIEFFKSDLGQTVLNGKNTVLREWPFTYALPAGPTAPEEQIIVQGIIDMLVQTPGGLIIIDFKTDNITEAEVSKRAELYKEQLNFYTKAATAILNKKVTTRCLYFLKPRTPHKIK